MSVIELFTARLIPKLDRSAKQVQRLMRVGPQ